MKAANLRVMGVVLGMAGIWGLVAGGCASELDTTEGGGGVGAVELRDGHPWRPGVHEAERWAIV